MIISLHNLSLNYNIVPIFQNISLTVFNSSVVHITGKNGAGKSSLLKIIAGVLKQNTGEVLFNNQKIEYEQAKINYIGHKLGIKKNLTVIENLLFWSSMNSSELMLPAAINYFGLNEILDTECYKLSEGWLKRVALARLLACNSNIWLLDEPEINLDEEGKKRLYHAIDVRTLEGGIVFITSHNEIPCQNKITLNLNEYNQG